MKKIIKFTAAFALLLIFAITFMASSYKTESNTKSENPPPCWIEIGVELHGDCVFVNDSTSYYVNLRIYNVCNDPSTPIYDETQHHPSEDGNYFSFCVEDTLCVTDMVNSCFKVVTTAYKLNTVNDVIVCSKTKIDPATNCEGLMEYGSNPIDIFLE